MDGKFHFSDLRTALQEAVSQSHLQLVHYLLYKGADQTILNESKETARDIASRKGFDENVITLFFCKTFE